MLLSLHAVGDYRSSRISRSVLNAGLSVNQQLKIRNLVVLGHEWIIKEVLLLSGGLILLSPSF
jgi:hypothetical protein